jgi:hypothetical protein
MPAIMTAKPQAVPALAEPLTDSDKAPIFSLLILIELKTIASDVKV